MKPEDLIGWLVRVANLKPIGMICASGPVAKTSSCSTIPELPLASGFINPGPQSAQSQATVRDFGGCLF